jgi:hypothetical protein
MRFHEDGLSIPDDLLIARDEGRVIFFCGAGISIARARLPDFFGLVDKVIEMLGVSSESPACKILKEAREIGKRTGVNGLISADLIFGLLERDFLVRDIEVAVAKALQPSADVDLSVHRILLDLASTSEEKACLVTTNFDRLFDSCDSNLKVWQPPKLPNPSQNDEMNGIIYLHGCTDKQYSGSDGSGFILSSSEFGRAYLSEAWATTFFKEVIEKYIVVFIGYSADDPPVRYLLEALNKREGQLNGVYAFQSGESIEAQSLWLHKGVQALSYPKNNRDTLWKTLEAWAVRATKLDDWYQSVISYARTGPKNLQPHERGQVAHIVSTLEGAKRFAEAEPPLPAEWLCVFDPYQRYAKPTQSYIASSCEPFLDPFQLYGLDSDVEPSKLEMVNRYTQREVPKKAWDAFARNRLDCQNFQEEDFSAFRGRFANNVSKLSQRMFCIGRWLAKIADRPFTVWWAAGQTGLHPEIQRIIKQTLADSQKNIHPNIRKAWQYLFEVWNTNINDVSFNFYELQELINKNGWDSSIVRIYISSKRAYLKIKPSRKPIADLADLQELQVSDMLKLSVEYPGSINLIIPDEWLAVTVRGLRENLEYAVQLETEIGSYSLRFIPPIIPDERADISPYARSHGLPLMILSFSSLFKRLMNLNIERAQQEFAAWPSDNETIFCRLRIWASGDISLISEQNFRLIIVSLSNDAFWNFYHQRDLLLVLAGRWKELSIDTRIEFEDRLLKGSSKLDYPEDCRASESLDRINWLANNNCSFTFDLHVETQKLQSIAPAWQIKNAMKAADSKESRGGTIQINSEYSLLLNEPYSSILSKALELSGRKENFLVEEDPFGGMSADYPIRAFSALTHAAKHNEYPKWAWEKFLYNDARKNDKPKFSALIAERISRYPNEALTNLVSDISYWVLNTDKNLSSNFPLSFEKIISKLVSIFQTSLPLDNNKIITNNREIDWMSQAISSPVGSMAQALFNDLKIQGIQIGEGLPNQWLIYAENLLSLDEDLHRHAIVIFSSNLDWFYFNDRDWSEKNLLSILERDSEKDKTAFWSGFLWNANAPHPELYERIKADLLIILKTDALPKDNFNERLAGILLWGWANLKEGDQKQFISNEEMRDVLRCTDEHFKLQVLWQLEIWIRDIGEDKKYSELLSTFFTNIWPRQISAKTQSISSRLLDIIFSNFTYFPILANSILPLLTTIGYSNIIFPDWIESYPNETLALLNVVLDSDVNLWPYKIEGIFQKISDADNRLNSNEILLELKRKWNAR